MPNEAKNLTLVVLAAGMGRRFGGLKQLTPVGPGGEAILDYTVFDAIRAGVQRVVFIIRPEIEAVFRSFVTGRFGPHTRVGLVFQRADALPDGFDMPPSRINPWGTGHALLSAAECVSEPFVVANADDFYGASAIAAVVNFLGEASDEYGLVTYAMRDTLAPDATVSRALCNVSAVGYLEGIEELTNLRATDRGAINDAPDETSRRFSGDEPVSMNLWGFQPNIFEHLRPGFRRFLGVEDAAHRAVAHIQLRGGEQADLESREYYLPDCVNELITAGRRRVRVLPAGESRWFGITYPADHARVVAEIRRLIEQRAYPERLWT